MQPLPATPELSRRQFIVTATTLAGGLALGIGIPHTAAHAATPPLARLWGEDAHDLREINAWIVIEPNDAVTLRVGHSEMGQGSATGLAMLIAEELECDWKHVRFEFASPNRNVREKKIYGDMLTVGSRGIRTSWQSVQQAGASARARLIAAAAQRWSVPAEECEAAMSRVTHRASHRALRYGELAAAAAQITLPAEPALRSPEQFKLAGKPLPRLDAAIKTDGSAQFGIDIYPPGTVHAAVIGCPVPGGKLVSAEESKIAGRRGVVQVVKLPDAVAVIADNFWRAKEAAAALAPAIVWDGGEGAKLDSAQLNAMYRALLDGAMVTARNDGDAKAQLRDHGDVIERVYEVPHLAHATMEPLNATAHLSEGRLDVWVGTQSADGATRIAAQAAGLAPEQVYLHNCYIGGGFGRRGTGDEIRQAVMIARAVGDRPVKMLWTREEDIRHSRLRPQAAIRFRSALDPYTKLPAALHIEIALDSIQTTLGTIPRSGIDPTAIDGIADSVPYNRVPHWYCGQALKNTHLLAGYWRSVGGSHNGFFMESFIDELAAAAGQDPLEYRRHLTDRVDVLGVLDTLKARADWGKPLGEGRGRGLAVVDNHGAVLGMVAEVSVNGDEVRVNRMVAAIDAYHVVNPNLVIAQVEGGVVFGLSAALYGEITISKGAVEQGNFDTYRVLRLADTPRTEVYLSLSGGQDEHGQPKWGGVGECGVAPVAAALTNAIFNATGKRVRSLPLKNLKLSQLQRT
jgi:isoquinoline 1-oxidoreductase beta subunit